MNLQALRYLVAVVEEGHFGRAAARMHVSQPSVSQAVARLEQQFGTQLLDRSGARTVPTGAGERVLDEVRAALRHVDQALGAAGAKVARDHLRIGCTPFLSMWVTVQWLTPFQTAHREVEVSAVELDVPAQFRALLTGEIDLALGEPLMADPLLLERTIREDRCAIWMSVDHALAKLDEVPLSGLAGIPIADPDARVYPYYHGWVRKTLRDAGVTPIFGPPVSDTPTGMSRVISGETVTISPDMLVDGAIPGVVVRRVSDPIRWRWVSTMRHDALSAIGVSFTAWACAQAGPSQTDRTRTSDRPG